MIDSPLEEQSDEGEAPIDGQTRLASVQARSCERDMHLTDNRSENRANYLLDWLLEISATSHGFTSLKAALAKAAEQSGFAGYEYIALLPGNFSIFSNLPFGWLAHSKKLSLEQRHPIIKKAQLSRRAFTWSQTRDARAMPDDHMFYKAASHYDIRSGLTIPIAISNGGISMLSFVSAKNVLEGWEEIDPIFAAAVVGQLHACIEHMEETPSRPETFYLSPKESTYTRWLSLGKTVEDVAKIEDVKYNTVRIALAEARRRYDLCNNTQLVAQAIRRGLI